MNLTYLNNLIHIRRYSGNLLIIPESVSDHVWAMNALAIEYVPKLNEKIPQLFNLEHIIYLITIHDIDESLYTDIPRNFKHRNKEILGAINKVAEEILSESKLDKAVLSDLKTLGLHSNKDSLLVKILDIVQAGNKMVQEIELGNKYFINELDNVIDSLRGLQLYQVPYIDNCGFSMDDVCELLNYFIEQFRTEFIDFKNSLNK